MQEQNNNPEINQTDYIKQYQGGFYGILKWPDLDNLWKKLKQDNKSWFVYQIGEAPSTSPLSHEEFINYLDELDKLLREEHNEKYCGIVYINEKETPEFIKIYDPANLGSSCGSSGAPPPLPGWTISVLPPQDLQVAFPIPAKRKRWWKKIFN